MSSISSDGVDGIQYSGPRVLVLCYVLPVTSAQLHVGECVKFTRTTGAGDWQF
jgi:hypothetical protein